MKVPERVIENIEVYCSLTKRHTDKLKEAFSKEIDDWYVKAVEDETPPPLSSIYGDVNSIFNRVANSVFEYLSAHAVIAGIDQIAEVNNDLDISNLPDHMLSLLIKYQAIVDIKTQSKNQSVTD